LRDDVRVKAVRAEIAITTARAVPRGAAYVMWERWINDDSDQSLGAVEQYRRQGDAPLLAAYAISHDAELREERNVANSRRCPVHSYPTFRRERPASVVS
jgi:hypothetical protein